MAETGARVKASSSQPATAYAPTKSHLTSPPVVELEQPEHEAETADSALSYPEPRAGSIFANVASTLQAMPNLAIQAKAEAAQALEEETLQTEVSQISLQVPDPPERPESSSSSPLQKPVQLKVADLDQTLESPNERQIEQPASPPAVSQMPVVQRSVIQRNSEAQSPQQAAEGLGTGGVDQDLDLLYAQAEVAQKELYEKVTAVAQKTEGKPSLPTSLKDRARSKQKIGSDYGGDASFLLDIARGSIVYENYDALLNGLTTCTKELNVVREKNRFAQPTPAGYRDILLNVKMSNGHIAELQLHLQQILDVKKGSGHKLYEEMRNIEAKAKEAEANGGSLEASELAKLKELYTQSRALYDQALQEAQTKKGETPSS